MSGAKIIRALEDAVIGNLSRVHIDGQTWARQEWMPIETVPKNTLKVASETLLLAHAEKKWIRFGKWYVQEARWYYSSTNERSQYAQVRGDDPTHWMPLPALPSPPRDGGR